MACFIVYIFRHIDEAEKQIHDRADILRRRMKKVFPLREYYIEKHTAGSTGDCLPGQTDG